jgi:hypothetical protein
VITGICLKTTYLKSFGVFFTDFLKLAIIQQNDAELNIQEHLARKSMQLFLSSCMKSWPF